MKPFEYARAGSLADALRATRRGATPLAGGTDLVGMMKDGVCAPARIVDLTGISALRGWSRARGRGLRIGALTPLVELETSASLARTLPILADALRDTATAQLRAMGTVGGNLLQRNRCTYFRDEAFPCWLKGGTRCYAVDGDNRLHAIVGAHECHMVAPSDLAPALIAYDATVTLRGTGARTISLEDLYRAPRGRVRDEHTLRPAEILAEVRIGETALARKGTYLKLMERNAWSFATVSIAAAARVRGGKLHDARLVLGGVAPVPWRVPAAERFLEGRAPDDAAADAAADVLLADALPLRDNAYKVTLARELVRRALRSLVG